MIPISTRFGATRVSKKSSNKSGKRSEAEGTIRKGDSVELLIVVFEAGSAAFGDAASSEFRLPSHEENTRFRHS